MLWKILLILETLLDCKCRATQTRGLTASFQSIHGSQPPGYPAPAGLGDAKASIGAACTLNGGGCHAVNGSLFNDPISKAAWNNIVNATGTDKSGGGNYMCVDTQSCGIVHQCTKCMNGKPTLGNRPQPLKPSGTVTVQGHTLYFYSDPLLGWCNAKDKNSACKCK
jgi:hypothetical protein